MVTLSTTQFEYIAVSEAFKECVWLKGIVREAKITDGTGVIYTDSQFALCLSKNPVYPERSKHIDVKVHFVRDKVTQEILNCVRLILL